MLTKIRRALANLFEDHETSEIQVSPVSHRTRYNIRAALTEVGYRAPGSSQPQTLLYPEVNRYGKRMWRAA